MDTFSEEGFTPVESVAFMVDFDTKCAFCGGLLKVQDARNLGDGAYLCPDADAEECAARIEARFVAHLLAA